MVIFDLEKGSVLVVKCFPQQKMCGDIYIYVYMLVKEASSASAKKSEQIASPKLCLSVMDKVRLIFLAAALLLTFQRKPITLAYTFPSFKFIPNTCFKLSVNITNVVLDWYWFIFLKQVYVPDECDTMNATSLFAKIRQGIRNNLYQIIFQKSLILFKSMSEPK